MKTIFLTPSSVFCKELQGCNNVQVIERRRWDRAGRSLVPHLKGHGGGPFMSSLQFKGILHVPETQNLMQYLVAVSEVPRKGQSLL